MSDEGFVGLHFKLIVAGAIGGVSILYSMTKPGSAELLAGLFVGAAVANYATPVILSDISSPWALLTAFFIGTAGKWLCRKGFVLVKSKVTFFKE
jgi:hypothetical protein